MKKADKDVRDRSKGELIVGDILRKKTEMTLPGRWVNARNDFEV